MKNKEGLMGKLLQKQQAKSLKKGDEIEATIVSLSKKGIFFDIGAKAYAVLGRLEQKDIGLYSAHLQPGQKIKVVVVSPEAKEGYPVVSLKNFFQKGKWEILKEKQLKEEEIEVVCGEYGKGGVFVDFIGIRGVIPKIQLTDNFIRQPEKLQGQKIRVKILEVDEEKNRLVVSQKAAVLKISQKELKERFDKIKVGEKYQGQVISVSEFGAFCDVEGVEGLIHISEISWEKVFNPTLYINPGQKIEVVVVEKNPKDFKLNLSLKRLMSDPWADIEKKYPKDKEIEGTLVRKERYGYFVKLEPGVEGLIHASKLKGDEKIEIGKKIKVYIERINVKTRRLSLLLPQKEVPITYR
jgi:ribosomal protein S1